MRVTVFNALATIIVIVTLFFFIAFYEKIPSLIPTHYGFNGEVDSWGSKNTLWYFVIGNIVIGKATRL